MPKVAAEPTPAYPPIDPEQPCFIRVPVKAIDVIVTALKLANMKSEAQAVTDFAVHYTDPESNAHRVAMIERAEEIRGQDGGDDNIEFDSDSTISESSDPGDYVLGWVWVPDDDKDDDDDDDDDEDEDQ